MKQWISSNILALTTITIACWGIKLQTQANNNTKQVEALADIVLHQKESIQTLRVLVEDQYEQLNLDRERTDILRDQLDLSVESLKTASDILNETLKQTSSLQEQAISLNQLETLGATPDLKLLAHNQVLSIQPEPGGLFKKDGFSPVHTARLVLQNLGGEARDIHIMKRKSIENPIEKISSYLPFSDVPILKEFEKYSTLERGEKRESFFQLDLLENKIDSFYFRYSDQLSNQYAMGVNYILTDSLLTINLLKPIKVNPT